MNAIRLRKPPHPRRLRFPHTIAAFVALLALYLGAQAALVEFQVAPQPAADALLAFSKITRIEVLFSFDDLRRRQSPGVSGRLEPDAALDRLLEGTGFAAHRNGRGKFVVTATGQPIGSVQGRLLAPDGTAAAGVRVGLAGTHVVTVTDASGHFTLNGIAPGSYEVVAGGGAYQPLHIEGVAVAGNKVLQLEPHTMQTLEDPARLEPFIVQAKSTRMRPLDGAGPDLATRRPTGNLDLPRSVNGPLPYEIYDREEIGRSGAVVLNDFLRRVVLESAAGPADILSSAGSPLIGSINLSLRGYAPNETVVLVNGRRLPEILTSGQGAQVLPPDVNFIPLSLVQQIEVLPTSASALYSGNPVGGVINIVLRPDVAATEVTTTYSNSLGGYDAPQSSVSLQHAMNLLSGRLRIRLNANFTQNVPPTEAELGLRRAHDRTDPSATAALFRATPNIRSADGSPLFGPGTSAFTSVAPGAEGGGGLAAFAGRAGLRNLDLFDSQSGWADSAASVDSPYGLRQKSAAWFGSFTLQATPWLDVGIDGIYSNTVSNPGLPVLPGTLHLDASSPFNPFGRDVIVTLNESAPLLGTDYSESRIGFTSAVAGLVLKLPANWRVSADGQVAHNEVKVRRLDGADADRWQELVDRGVYNPLRDTQVSGPPPEFYDEVLVYRGGRDTQLKIGSYDTLDAAIRVSNQALPLPTGQGAVVGGVDYRRNHLASYAEQRTFGDGTPIGDPGEWSGRTLQRYSFFGELQAPLLPARWRPRWLRNIESDIAVRYVAADTSKEANVAPTYSAKLDFAGGFSLRGSFTASSRFPTPQLSREVSAPSGTGGGPSQSGITDPMRGGESYQVATDDAFIPNINTESAATQTAGIVFQRGDIHRIRASLDFVDTRKQDEILWLEPQDLVNVEPLFPDRVQRASAAPGDPYGIGRITLVRPGSVNASWRHSQNWNATLDYNWVECAGGTLDVHARLVYFQSYQLQFFADEPVVDELRHPDVKAPGILKYRATFGAGWSNPRFGFGIDGQYFHSRVLPQAEWASQGGRTIDPFWQYDAYIQSDLDRWLTRRFAHRGLRAQLRVNNVFGADFPDYANDAFSSGVQAYSDWRGRTYTLSLTATF